MATLVFGALGTLVGGPVGGAIGALLGRATDRALLGTPTREGPRLTELAVSSSSYGQPLARHFGAMRAAGTIIWATELKVTQGRSGGGKGQAATTSYSYAVSLAVALSSRPITGVGRIWADGNLLRGAAGDLKTGGTLRIHLGHADQARDPLLAAALGDDCPAHRGLAYAVLEDLQLADFGNRIPALSFEVFASGAGAALIPALVGAADPVGAQAVPEAQPIAGFAHDGGTVAQVLDLLGQAVPIVADSGGPGLLIGPGGTAPVALPEPIAADDGEFGTRTGARRARRGTAGSTALRYYDSARDYQPGLQRSSGRAPQAGERVLELPATLTAAGAAVLADALRLRGASEGERLQLRIAALDPALRPGALVAMPGQGLWRVEAWEWRSTGIELDLRRAPHLTAQARSADPGTPWRPADRLPAPTILTAFELPWDGTGAADAVRVHAALGAGAGRWAGASLFVERAGALAPLATSGPARASTARLDAALPGSPALLFEPTAQIDLACDDPDTELTGVDGAALAAGANRLLVGNEIVQFSAATPLGVGRWRLRGLLRGRGGTEAEARAGHGVGVRAVLLDERLLLLDAASFDPATERLAAIGLADAEPVFAAVAAPGRSRRPLAPVHPGVSQLPSGGLAFRWTRRARGAWAWRDGIDVPLVEEGERYELGAGPVAAPVRIWTSEVPALVLSAEDLAPLAAGTAMWVRQLGTHARSPELLLHHLP
jgi:hypothetical protein